MIALPVLAASTVSVIARSEERDPQDVVAVELGTQAQALITATSRAVIEQDIDGQVVATIGSEPEPSDVAYQDFRKKVDSVISPRNRVVTDDRVSAGGAGFFGNLSAIQAGQQTVGAGGRRYEATVRELDDSASGAGGLLEPISGRAPQRAGEVVVSRNLTQNNGIKVGDRLALRLRGVTEANELTVVGVVHGPPVIDNPSVIGLPGGVFPAGGLDAAESWEVVRGVLVMGPDPVTWEQVRDLNQAGAAVTSRAVIANPPPPDQVNTYSDGSVQVHVVGITVVVLGLGLLQIALLAGPAIAVGARRNQRALAMMAAVGAENRHLRSVVLATSAVIGVVSSAVAAGLGVGLGAVILVLLQAYFDNEFLRIDVHAVDLLAIVGVGALTAVAAALIPARQMARMDVLAALTGRRGHSSSRLRAPLAGLLLVGIGAGLAFFGSQIRREFTTVIGLVLTEIGLVLGVAAAVALTGRVAGRLPFTPRFALRDAARQRSRTAPAVAAVLAAVASGTTALVYVASQDLNDSQTYQLTGPLGNVRVELLDEAGSGDFGPVEAAVRRVLPIDRVATYQGLDRRGPDEFTYFTPVRSPANACPLGFEMEMELETDDLRELVNDPRCVDPNERVQGFDFPGTPVFDDGSALTLLVGAADPDRNHEHDGDLASSVVQP